MTDLTTITAELRSELSDRGTDPLKWSPVRVQWLLEHLPALLNALEQEKAEGDKLFEDGLAMVAGAEKILERAETAVASLDRAWADINALGGAPTNPEEEAFNDAILKALTILEGLGATDRTWRAEF